MLNRRTVLKAGLAGAGLFLAQRGLVGCGDDAPGKASTRHSPWRLQKLGPLQAPNNDGLKLPAGFTSRLVARSGDRVGATGYTWHGAPDGGATFPTPGGGWYYVSNSELGGGSGGVGILEFSREGEIVAARSILSGTSRNCAGGVTPWGTWLSCEEVALGRVFECTLTGSQGRELPALGRFFHEAVAVDPERQRLYLTEDQRDGLLYRFTPANYPNLDAGILEVLAGEEGGVISWLPITDPTGAAMATRYQASGAKVFNGGEGIWYHQGILYFATKGDNRVWALRVDEPSETLSVLYDPFQASNPILTGVDNVVVSDGGDVVVAEDGGTMELCALSREGEPVALVAVEGQYNSEITGPAFSPDGTKLYFSSQRGSDGRGLTFEVSGAFRA